MDSVAAGEDSSRGDRFCDGSRFLARQQASLSMYEAVFCVIVHVSCQPLVVLPIFGLATVTRSDMEGTECEGAALRRQARPPCTL